MKQGSKKGIWAVAALVLLAGVVVVLFHSARPVSAGGIRRDPRAFEGRTVTLSGTVVGGVSLSGLLMQAAGGAKGAFLLDDGTGQIAVTVDGSVPLKGQRVVVRGQVQLLGYLGIPEAWLRALGVAANSPSSGEMTLVVIHAKRVWTR